MKGVKWRRGAESNRRIKVLQTSPLPLGYRALGIKLAFYAAKVYRAEGRRTIRNSGAGDGI